MAANSVAISKKPHSPVYCLPKLKAYMMAGELNQELGNIDLYLLDAILKQHISQGMRLLDVGCGEGRNLHWFIRNRWDVQGIDQNPAAIRMLQYVSQSLAPGFDRNRFQEAKGEEIPFPAANFDAVISSAVLHFADNPLHFLGMWKELVRVLRPGGLLFVRMATSIGMPEVPQTDESGRCLLPDGSFRFLLTERLLEQLLQEFELSPVEPVKSVVVHQQRAMASLLLRKNNSTTP